MKILLVSQYFWPERFRVNDLVQGWLERGHEVTVLTGVPNYPGGRVYPGYSAWRPQAERFGDAQVIRVPLIPRGDGRRIGLVANYLSYVATASVLGPLRCRESYDCIFVYQLSPFTVGVPAALMKWLKGAPIAFWVQDLWPETLEEVHAIRSRPLLASIGRLVEWTYARCDLVLVQSRRFEKAVLERGVPRSRLRYLPNWCESFYRPVTGGPPPVDISTLPQGFVLLFAGNLGDAQALDTILDAAAQVRNRPDVQWVFLGDGSRRQWLQRQIVRRNLHQTVHWLGSRPAEEMPYWFAAADALLVTLRRGPAMASTLPIKLQSYLACARPVLAAVDGETGAVVSAARAGRVGPAEDADSLARNALMLADMPAEARAVLGEQGREYFTSHFARDRLLGRLDDWLQALGTGPRPKASRAPHGIERRRPA